MSRSYREPWFVDGYGTKSKRYMKRSANRAVRHAINLPNGKGYRKFFNPYDICDFRIPYNPWPIYYFKNGDIKTIEPNPEWKARRK